MSWINNDTIRKRITILLLSCMLGLPDFFNREMCNIVNIMLAVNDGRRDVRVDTA